jgi:hypothetical protein
VTAKETRYVRNLEIKIEQLEQALKRSQETWQSETKQKSPIQSGWRGNLNGALENTKTSWVEVSEITLKLDRETVWALCNHLTDGAIQAANSVENKQVDALSTLGAALGRSIDHHSANNGGRELVKG